MPKVRTEDDCCGQRKSTGKKKEAARSKKKSQNVTSSCCAGKRLTCAEISKVEEEPPIKCDKTVKKKKPKRIVKKQESCTIDFRILAKIKPSVSDRERYSNVYHFMCALEAEELVRLKEVQKCREKMEECHETDNQTPETDQSIKQTTSSATNDENVEEKSLAVEEKESEQTAENKKVKIAEDKCALENKIECDSICSFDSEIDLSCFHLTKEDVEKIEKNREQIREEQKKKAEEGEA